MSTAVSSANAAVPSVLFRTLLLLVASSRASRNAAVEGEVAFFSSAAIPPDPQQQRGAGTSLHALAKRGFQMEMAAATQAKGVSLLQVGASASMAAEVSHPVKPHRTPPVQHMSSWPAEPLVLQQQPQGRAVRRSPGNTTVGENPSTPLEAHSTQPQQYVPSWPAKPPQQKPEASALSVDQRQEAAWAEKRSATQREAHSTQPQQYVSSWPAKPPPQQKPEASALSVDQRQEEAAWAEKRSAAQREVKTHSTQPQQYVSSWPAKPPPQQKPEGFALSVDQHLQETAWAEKRSATQREGPDTDVSLSQRAHNATKRSASAPASATRQTPRSIPGNNGRSFANIAEDIEGSAAHHNKHEQDVLAMPSLQLHAGVHHTQIETKGESHANTGMHLTPQHSAKMLLVFSGILSGTVLVVGLCLLDRVHLRMPNSCEPFQFRSCFSPALACPPDGSVRARCHNDAFASFCHDGRRFM